MEFTDFELAYHHEVADCVVELAGRQFVDSVWASCLALSEDVEKFLRIPHPLFEFPEDAAEAFLAVRRGTADYLPIGQKINRRRNPRVMFRKEWNLEKNHER